MLWCGAIETIFILHSNLRDLIPEDNFNNTFVNMSLPVCEPESDAKIQTFILLESFFEKYFIKQVFLDFIK